MTHLEVFLFLWNTEAKPSHRGCLRSNQERGALSVFLISARTWQEVGFEAVDIVIVFSFFASIKELEEAKDEAICNQEALLFI
jgi:hypothetical protein